MRRLEEELRAPVKPKVSEMMNVRSQLTHGHGGYNQINAKSIEDDDVVNYRGLGDTDATILSKETNEIDYHHYVAKVVRTPPRPRKGESFRKADIRNAPPLDLSGVARYDYTQAP